MLRDNAVINDVMQLLDTEGFYFDAHQKIFQAIKTIYNDGHPVDILILKDHLQQAKQIEDVGGDIYLAELWEAAPTAANAEYYAKIVRDKAITRSLIHASTEILRDAYDQAYSAEEMLGAAERKVLDIADKGVTSNTYTLLTALNEAYTRIDQRAGRTDPNAISGVASGFIDLDQLTAGFQNSELIILAARPSVGKTAMALNIVRHVIVEEQLPVLFVSLEQTRIELAEPPGGSSESRQPQASQRTSKWRRHRQAAQCRRRAAKRPALHRRLPIAGHASHHGERPANEDPQRSPPGRDRLFAAHRPREPA